MVIIRLSRFLAAGGSKRADEICEGDLLWSQDEDDPAGQWALKRVEEVFVLVSPVVNLHVGGRIIRTTAEHPFYVQGRGWIAAGFLEIGDSLQSHDGKPIAVEGLADSGELLTVYNFRIADYHTYFVGWDEWGFDVWAHNAYNAPIDVRDAAVAAAWKQEADLVRRTGQGTRNWTAKQMQQLLDTGKVRGYIGHHINSVNDSPLFAGLPDNIQFLTFRQHYRIHNNGRYRIPVYGEMLSR